MGKKRKHGELSRGSEPSSESMSSKGFGIGHTLSLLREPPPSPIATAAQPSSGQVDSNGTAEGIISADWKGVDHKAKEEKESREKRKLSTQVSPTPKAQMQNPIKISDLQGLVLYCFADGVAPQWISVKHSGHVKKVVVVMVPGLEPGMFDGSIPLIKEPTVASTANGSTAEGEGLSEFERWKKGLSPTKDSPRSNPKALSREQLPEPLQPLADMFPHVWPVKSPGDTKYNKLHSPLQAILMSSLPKSKESGRASGPKPHRGESSWVSQRTPITSFIATVSDLKEGDYALHPAMFDVAEEKQANTDIRVKAGQTPEHGWVDTTVTHFTEGIVPEKDIQGGSLTAGRQVLALDCEMCITEGGVSELARISLVGWDGEVVLDELVKPQRPVIDYLTQYSGMTKEKLDPVTTTLSDVQKKLLDILHPPERSKRANWATISIEDAKAVLDLVKQKCEKGERWGAGDSFNESIFRRLSRASRDSRVGQAAPGEGRTGAVVDWGNPERGFGAHATVALGCRNDDEVVVAVDRAVNGDEDGHLVPGGGVDFTWARLRELEVMRGWCNRVPGTSNTDDSAPVAVKPSSAADDPEFLAPAVAKLVAHIKRIYDGLPPCTLFIVYSGTGDPRDVVRLQAMHRTYMEEFRSRKPWHELSVKWTDTEEQALKKALVKAREGCGFMTVK
ncbi:RNA exonuclease 3 [Coccidioides immitis RMSCC 3703]|uniref:RNA exonuclease 3 n=1 Tax=Coccidioides immitis RMSCC 3703 TaxID=454286 RepID=A0A0J8TU50_COCIT|nr:RNA exonuclease 3 [Coccidioides immitis RMSCC 3703]